MSKLIRSHLPIVVFLVLYTLVISYKLISHPTPFYDWDESIYMEVGKEMVQAKSLVPLWQGTSWLEKPPLAPVAYGLISALPIQPEVSTRLFSLLLAVVALGLIYIWGLRITKRKEIAFLTVFLTSLTPLFLHRAQIVNTDSMLLIGWFGYLLFYPRFWLSLLFLALGVYSKSLLGFYPMILLGLFDLYRLLRHDISFKKFSESMRLLLIQVGLISVWFIIMYLFYGREFLQVHFYDHLFKRVTSSIESHFGQRTFYFDIIFSQFNVLLLMLIPSFILFIRRFLQKKISDLTLINSLFLIPWFLFLNITKTKISWYAYPVIPQFALLIVYPLSAIKNSKPILYVISGLFMAYLLYQTIFTYNFFNTYYSSYDANYQIASAAKSHCNSLDVLIDPDGRKTYTVLKSMNLLITTSTWYGNHPSTVYYLGKKVNFVYDKNTFQSRLATDPEGTCLEINEEDANLPLKQNGFKLLRDIDQVLLFQKREQ